MGLGGDGGSGGSGTFDTVRHCVLSLRLSPGDGGRGQHSVTSVRLAELSER